jgi:hypothetical protein
MKAQHLKSLIEGIWRAIQPPSIPTRFLALCPRRPQKEVGRVTGTGCGLAAWVSVGGLVGWGGSGADDASTLAPGPLRNGAGTVRAAQGHPNLSDDQWISLQGQPGANAVGSAAATEDAGNLCIGGPLTGVGQTLVNRVAKCSGEPGGRSLSPHPTLSPPSGSGEGRRPRVCRPSHGLLSKHTLSVISRWATVLLSPC